MSEKRPVVIVGTGAVGSALAAAAAQAGYPIAGIVSRSMERASELAGLVGATHAATIDAALPPRARLIFLCVPDDFVRETATRFSVLDAPWNTMVFAHVSGALSSDELLPVAERGAEVMSFHPMQSFSKRSPAAFHDIYVGIEGTQRALKEGRRIARNLGAHPIVIQKRDKRVYHLAASIASNHLVVLMSMARDLLESIGCSPQEAAEMLGPLVLTTAQNALTLTPREALTGPAVRGDINTIGFHFETIRLQFPHYAEAYRAMTQQAIDIAVKSGRLDPRQAIQLKNRLL